MFSKRYERAEQLRASVQADTEQVAPSSLADLAQGDAAAVQAAWSGFVPYLAHPVMAASATGAMAVLDEAAALVGTRRGAAA